MKKSRFTLGLKGKTLIPLVTLIIISIAVQLAVVLTLSSDNTSKLSDKLMNEMNAHYAGIIQGEINAALSSSRALLPVFESSQENGLMNRENDIAFLKRVLTENPDTFDVYTAWEPNAYDGKDSSYVGKPYHDDTGRFVPFIYRSGTDIAVEALVDYEKPGAGDYYLVPKQTGKIAVIEPYTYPVNGTDVLMTSMVVPIIINGKFHGIVGEDILTDTLFKDITGVKLFDTGYMFMVGAQGQIISHPDKNMAGKSLYDVIGQSATALVKSSFSSGNSVTFNDTAKNGVVYRYVISPVSLGEKYWLVCSVVPASEITASTVYTLKLGIIVGFAAVVLLITIVVLLISKMIRPIRSITKAAAAIQVGSLDKAELHELSQINRQDELGQLADSMIKAVDSITKVAEDTTVLGDAAARNDLSVEIDINSHHGIYRNIIELVYRLFEQLNTTISSLATIAEQVSTGSVLVATNAQTLAQGATQQASAVEELSASLEQIATQTNQNARNADKANEYSETARLNAVNGNTQMNEMLTAMDDISTSSKNINKIIKVIDDIAFQTNILALNAAVEAARAGQHGKGFAVVAEEVRTLAAKSASAARETTEMIETAIRKVAVGTKITNETATALEKIVSEVEKSAELVRAIAVSSKDQSAGIEQVNLGVTQISQVVQTNAATSEESAAASEELSGQAGQLIETVKVFKLKK